MMNLQNVGSMSSWISLPAVDPHLTTHAYQMTVMRQYERNDEVVGASFGIVLEDTAKVEYPMTMALEQIEMVKKGWGGALIGLVMQKTEPVTLKTVSFQVKTQ